MCEELTVQKNELPVVVIGAGPQGLAAAAHLVERGQAGARASRPATARLQRCPSGGTCVCSPSGASWSTRPRPACSSRPGGRRPRRGIPTGAQWISGYLAPLADVLGDRIRYGSRVIGVSRRGRDRLVDAGRAEQPFTVHVETADGNEYRIDARAVIDASGTWSTPNPAGADGLPALGERAAAELLDYRIPDFRHRTQYDGKHSVVVGSGHSAVTAVIALGRIARRDPATKVTWVLRRGAVGNTFGGGEADELPARGQLGHHRERVRRRRPRSTW